MAAVRWYAMAAWQGRGFADFEERDPKMLRLRGSQTIDGLFGKAYHPSMSIRSFAAFSAFSANDRITGGTK
jgi:hypothetical protein